jgi:hypothetical protein
LPDARPLVLAALVFLAVQAEGADPARFSPRDTTEASGVDGVEPDSGLAASDAAVAEVLFDFESAWRAGDRKRLVSWIARRGVGLSLGGGEHPEGWFSRNQALAILGRLIEGTETIQFEFVRFRNLHGRAGRPNAAAVWEQRDRSGELRRLAVFLSLGREDDRWTIAEIKVRDQ